MENDEESGYFMVEENIFPRTASKARCYQTWTVYNDMEKSWKLARIPNATLEIFASQGNYANEN